MNRVSVCAVLLTLLVCLTNCRYLSSIGVEGTQQTSNLTATPTVLVAESPTPAKVLQDRSEALCNFLQHTREYTLLENTHDQAATEPIIMSVYALSEDDHININTSHLDGMASHYYEWSTAAPYFGKMYYTASGTDDNLHVVGALSFTENPPLFTLQEVFSCLGMPAGYGTFLVIFDDNAMLQHYDYPVTDLSLYYSQHNLLLKLLYPTNDEILNIDTKVHLFATQVYSRATTVAEVKSEIEASYGQLEDWTPASWQSTP